MTTAIRPLIAAVALLATAGSTVAGEFPDAWYYYASKNAKVERLRQLEGRPAPPISVRDWIGDAPDLANLKGSVVVVDFWGTWCPPCRASIPKNIELVKKHRDDDLVFIGIHDSKRDVTKMPGLARQMKINYPVAIDVGMESERAWRVGFWPTYAVVDRWGNVRAAGLQPQYVSRVVETLLAETAAPTPRPRKVPSAVDGSGVPGAWLEQGRSGRGRFDRILAAPTPPAIESATWMNSDPLSLEDLRGKVVMIDFWATWCGPCLKSVPKINALQKQYGPSGLVIIGVCHSRKSEVMDRIVRERGIEYPVCVDAGDAIAAQYQPDGRPDYYFIDRAGKLRIADCKNQHIENAIKMLIAEPAPKSGPTSKAKRPSAPATPG